jgi:predicted PurR-regulated permease PerM
MGESDHTERLRNGALAVIALGVLLAGLIYRRSFLIPLAIAILLRNLLEAVIERFPRIRIGDTQLPRWLAALLGIAVVVLGLYMIQSILLGQVDAVASAWPRYMSRLESIIGDLTQWLGAEQSAKLKQAIMGIDLTRRIAGVVSSAQSFVVSFLLILAYVGFLFVESAHMREKITAMFPNQTRAREVNSVLTAVSEYEPVRHHSVAGLLGHDLGYRGNVSQRAHYGACHDRVRAHPELERGGHSAVEGWPHRSLNAAR